MWAVGAAAYGPDRSRIRLGRKGHTMPLHMIVNTHNPESCAYRGESEEEALTTAFTLLDERAGEHDVKLQGSWVNRASHEIFILADAPNGHAIEAALLAAGLVGRTHARVLAVVTVQEVLDADGTE
jgi:hypothetical protein